MKSWYILVSGAVLSLALAGCANHGSGQHHHHHKHGHKYMTKDQKPTNIPRRDLDHRHVDYKHHNNAFPHNPSHYSDTRDHAHTRMSHQRQYGEGYDAGCRTAWTGGNYKNAKRMANDQAYQMGWSAGFNQCHHDRTHIDTQTPRFSYIPY